MRSILIILPILATAIAADLPRDYVLPPPPGPFVSQPPAPQRSQLGIRSGEPTIATTYFYWYDAATRLHVVDHDGTDALTDHPPTLEGFSYKNVDWHAEQLRDMIAAGIDVVMPVYWGSPSPFHPWSDEGLPPLVAARERLLAAGERPPAIGMFYDTSTLRANGGRFHVDCRTRAGRRWFYGTIRNFFSLVPPEHRATIDGKPLVFLYSPSFAKGVDEELFPAVRRMLRDELGFDIYLVKMRGWPGVADAEYQWGAALGPQFHDVAAIGPGYDHSAVPGRAPLVRDREDGKFYRGAWKRLLAKPPERRQWLVHLETWNEFHEGTEICHSAEYGRRYIELTHRFADLFHARRQIEPAYLKNAPPVVSTSPDDSRGIRVVPKPEGDGPLVKKTVAGRRAWQTTANKFSPGNRYLYFDVDEDFLFDGDEPLEVTVRYFDAGPDAFVFQYDSSDPDLAGLAQEFRSGHVQPIEGTGTWREVKFTVPHARFAGRTNGTDCRLACRGGELTVGEVSMRRPASRQKAGLSEPLNPSPRRPSRSP